ncbi:hypothetical protein PV08_01773 [Exophiala spinifera]|uniref:Heterokaryon incompatibility domain-containing protein n=1 Tax=Exophiala spinifera TaxID=91928 RepID=A0A0D2BQF1_9EURO|nr:uncharacterized protein PV08_01773 [Exophiala spinifera]KIW21193.1 hypothetical protein PV08_01773 [Exophiala spinifera]
MSNSFRRPEPFRSCWECSDQEDYDPPAEEEIEIAITPYADAPLEMRIAWPNQSQDGQGRWKFVDLEFYCHAGDDAPFEAFHQAPEIPQNSDSDASFSLIQGWIETCSSEHDLCNEDDACIDMPTRLLAIGDTMEPNTVRLTSDPRRPSKYAALSHSWGESKQRLKQVPKTKRDNIRSRERDIPWSELTKTFQDAILIARRLGLEYLWIDALCIIQDFDDDWAMEASRMAAIYGNAHVVISATRSETGDGGCFADRPSSFRVPSTSCVYVRATSPHRDLDNGKGSSFGRSPLLDRAWVYQERLLAKRVVHYREHEIMWECRKCVWCECGGHIDRNFKFNLASLLHDKDNIPQRYLDWSLIVNRYTGRFLFADADRLPALSGIAGRFHLPGMGRYLAGLWGNSMPESLTWGASRGAVGGRQMRRPEEYRAPTWSWASVEAAFGMYIPDDDDNPPGYKCRVIAAECILKSPDPYGRLVGGHVLLSGLCFTVILERSYEDLRPNQIPPKYVLRVEDRVFDLNEDVPLDDPSASDHVSDGTSLLVLVLVGNDVVRTVSDEDSRDGYFKGIALRRSVRDQGAYERVGRVIGPMDAILAATLEEVEVKIV